MELITALLDYDSYNNNWLVGMALYKPADRHGFVHTYRLINGRGYHIPTDSKWAWLMEEARLRVTSPHRYTK